MITLTRRQLLAVKNVLKKSVWFQTPRGLRPPVVFAGSAGGLTVHSRSDRVAIEFRDPAPQLERNVRLPAAAIEELAARDDTPVTIEQVLQNESQARWIDGDLPQQRSYQLSDSSRQQPFPERPAVTCANASELVAAIHRAGAATDRESSRYALDHIRLSALRGEIAATDGRQALVENGYRLPRDGDRLVAWNPIFGTKELAAHASVEIGAVANGVYFGLGAWSIWLLGSPDAKFPRLDDVFPAAAAAAATHKVVLGESDAEYLLAALPKLPGSDRQNEPIDLVIGDELLIRATGETGSQPTELVLSQSRVEGDASRYSTNRRFLIRALELGFREVAFFPGHRALCESSSRRYLWALCEPAPEKTGLAPIRVESPTAIGAKSLSNPPKRILPMSTSPQTVKPRHADAQPAALDPPAVGSPLEKALSVRASLREALAANYELVAALKRQKRQSRIVETTLASLKQLQRIGA